MDEPHIILATLDDIDSIYRIEGKVFHCNSWSYEMIRVELLDGKINGKTWVLNINNNIIGYCMVRFGPDEVHIINMAIDTKFQQNGYGKKLIHHILEETPINSFVFLEVKRSNFSAISLYLKVGFEKIQIRNKYYSDGADAIVMRLQK